MPQVKYLFGSLQKENALGESRIFASGSNRTLNIPVAGA
jgi:hypothetical protein